MNNIFFTIILVLLFTSFLPDDYLDKHRTLSIMATIGEYCWFIVAGAIILALLRN